MAEHLETAVDFVVVKNEFVASQKNADSEREYADNCDGYKSPKDDCFRKISIEFDEQQEHAEYVINKVKRPVFRFVFGMEKPSPAQHDNLWYEKSAHEDQDGESNHHLIIASCR